MTRSAIIAALLAATTAATATTALSAQDNRLGTLQKGKYICSLPGDAEGPTRILVASEDFTVTNSSTYSSAQGGGTYLLTGKRIVFSRGPMKGMTYVWENLATLRKLDDQGRKTGLRCTRRAERR